MKKVFIKMNDDRIRLSVIKKYKAMNDLSLIIYYSTSRDRVDPTVYKFFSKAKRNAKLESLDIIFGVVS